MWKRFGYSHLIVSIIASYAIDRISGSDNSMMLNLPFTENTKCMKHQTSLTE